MHVEIRTLNPHTAADEVAGTISWTGSRIVAHSEHGDRQDMMNEIAGEPVRDHKTGKMLYPDSDPKEWLAALSSNYYSPYLRATLPK